MSSPIIYLAVPYSHPDPAVCEARFMAANKAAGLLMRRGLFVFSPISHTHPIALACDLPRGFEYWGSYDRAMLARCGKMVVLKIDGWQDSVGVQAEIEIARALGITIEYMDPVP